MVAPHPRLLATCGVDGFLGIGIIAVYIQLYRKYEMKSTDFSSLMLPLSDRLLGGWAAFKN
jgi:hypothetical protein